MNSRKMIQTAFLIALVTLATLVIKIPLPSVQGYINFGDTIILLSGIIFGPQVGALAGSFGSSLADILSGYTYWAPWTFLIKGLEGFLVGYLVLKNKNKPLFGSVLAALVMVFGYFLVGILYYGFGPALTSVPGDLLQGGVSVIICLSILNPLRNYLKSSNLS